MTGFGDARHHDHRCTILAEVRTVNNRHFKLTARITESHAMVEPALEQLVREQVRRGSVQVNLKIERPRQPEDYRVNAVALASYRDQIERLRGPELGPLDMAQLLVLPGVVEESREQDQAPDPGWPQLAKVVSEALARLQSARAQEGRAMAQELTSLCRAIGIQLSSIADRGPQVVQSIQARMHERVQALVQDNGLTVGPNDLAREIAILADRSDISEELVRLRAHLAQFDAVIAEAESSGRKLEFVAQEMGREINTIGSKANDVQISRSVVEVKALLEKIRELVQNVE
jgi:uncharacterized protein (TIGR00255 family)